MSKNFRLYTAMLTPLLFVQGATFACSATADGDTGDDSDSESDTGSELDSDTDTNNGPDVDAGAADGGLLGGITLLELTRDDADQLRQSRVSIWGPWDRPLENWRFGFPWEFVSELIAEAGDCALVDSAPVHNCTPACGAGEWCTADGACIELPSDTPAGSISITGTTLDFVLEMTEFGYVLSPDAPENMFDPGVPISLVAAAGDTPSFSMSAEGVSDLSPPLQCPLSLVGGQDFELTWTPSDDGARIRFEVIATYHAGNGPMIICETDDDGSLVISKDLVDAYLPFQTSFETATLTRFQRAYGKVTGTDKSMYLEIASARVCY